MPPLDSRLPTGTVTFVFTDIEGSTQLVSMLGEAYGPVLAAHSAVIRSAISGHRGREVSTEGDAFFAVFASATDAIDAAADVQRALARYPWPDGGIVRVRMGIHTGEGRLGGDDYIGIDVNRAARIAAAAHGGQVLLSDTTRSLVEANLAIGLTLRSLGEHRLKDLPALERIWQLDIDGVAQEFPLIRSLSARPGNLAVPPTPLIGRGAELAVVAGLVGRRRLLTMIGPGGTGKTRLALAVAERLAPDFADGAFFVALQDARERSDVAAATARALGVRERPDRDLEQGVKEHLRDRDLLLVLDNFEQVLPSTPFVTELLADSSRVRVIVTSRAVLHVSGEQIYDVPPLSLPVEADLAALEALGRSEAVALFVERAGAVRPGFVLTRDNARAVSEICRRLDGLPLAVELAAARVRLLTPEAMLDRLERQLPVLVGGGSDRPARQQTLRAAIDWSYNLLEGPEQRLLERLAVFAGGWGIEAADAICNSSAELGIETLDGLTTLADMSLIRTLPSGDGEARFGMLQVIREFAAEKLDAAIDAGEIHRRHATYQVRLAEVAGPELRSAELRRWQQRLRLEQENVRSALRWAVEGGDAVVGLRTAGAIWDYWHYWAELREGVRWLDALLASPSAATAPSLVRVRALRALAGLLYWQGDAARSFALYDEALSIVRGLGDDALIAAVLQDSAWAALALGDLALAIERAEEGVERYRRAGDDDSAELVRAWTLISPVIMGHGGDTDAAIAASQLGIEIHRRHSRAHDVADWLEAQAMIYRATGDAARADTAGKETLRAWHALGTLGRLPLSLKILAAVELAKGRADRAVRLGAAADRYNDEVGGELPDAIAQLGDPVEEARPLLEPEEHARAVAEGRSMSLDEQIAYALE